MSAVRAVIFDFDGTLADSYAAIAASVNHVRAGRHLPALTEREVRQHVGRGPIYLMEHTVPSGDVESNVAAYKAHHPSVMHKLTQLLPGADDCIRTLHKRGLRLGVCSNKPVAFTRELLAQLALVEAFSAVLGPEDVARPKPAPDMLLAALPRLGVTAAEALYVGDMVVDIETARAAGVRVWVVPTGSEERSTLVDAKPDRLLDGLGKLAGLI